MESPTFLADALPQRRKRSNKRERSFLTDLRHSFEERGAFFFKIADLPHFPGARFRFDLDKPFDAFVCYKGVPVAIEAKTLKGYQALGSQLRPSQIEGLDSFVAAGGRGFLFVNIRSLKPRYNRLIIFDWSKHGKFFSDGHTIRKKDLECLPYRQGIRVKVTAKKTVTRFKLDRFLTSLTIKRR